jgi:uncharacterized membrane protein
MGGKEEQGFATELSYILIGGVGVSFAIEIAGILWYYLQTGGLTFDFSSQWQLSGASFFGYLAEFLSSNAAGMGPLRLMTLGIIVLMLTPYLRVAASAVHFGTTKDIKYLAFTLFVLTVLTLSLSLH